MIVVVGRVVSDAARRDELLRAGQAMVRASRAEAGCLGYALYADTEDPDRFAFVEEWADQAALDAHFATAHAATFMAAVGPTLAAPPDVAFHTVASTAGLPDAG